MDNYFREFVYGNTDNMMDDWDEAETEVINPAGNSVAETENLTAHPAIREMVLRALGPSGGSWECLEKVKENVTNAVAEVLYNLCCKYDTGAKSVSQFPTYLRKRVLTPGRCRLCAQMDFLEWVDASLKDCVHKANQCMADLEENWHYKLKHLRELYASYMYSTDITSTSFSGKSEETLDAVVMLHYSVLRIVNCLCSMGLIARTNEMLRFGFLERATDTEQEGQNKEEEGIKAAEEIAERLYPSLVTEAERGATRWLLRAINAAGYEQFKVEAVYAVKSLARHPEGVLKPLRGKLVAELMAPTKIPELSDAPRGGWATVLDILKMRVSTSRHGTNAHKLFGYYLQTYAKSDVNRTLVECYYDALKVHIRKMQDDDVAAFTEQLQPS